MPKVEGYETVRQYEALVAECDRLRRLYEEKLAHYRIAFNSSQLSGSEEDRYYAQTLYHQAQTLLNAWQDMHAIAARQKKRAERAARIRLRPSYRRSSGLRRGDGAPPRH